MYCCLHLFVYLYIFYLGTCAFVHGSLLYMHICVTTVVCMYEVCIYVCSSHIVRLMINRVRLLILLVVI